METENTEKLSTYLTALKKAKGDNEKFATLLMVAKITKGETCTIEDKRKILDAIGSKFISRLLKTKNVPDDCPANIFKSVAMSVLSALCSETDLAESPVLIENIPSFNSIILQDPGADDRDSRQLVDDVYQCYNSLCRTPGGLAGLQKGGAVSSLCDAVTTEAYGHEKARDVLYYLVSCSGPDVWVGCEKSFNSLLTYLGQQFTENQDATKFELCKALVFLLASIPADLEKSVEPPWLSPIVTGLEMVLKCKLGRDQREPALRLASTLVQVCGIYSVLPPYTPDCKLFLLTTHLCCVEVRMILESYDIKEANKNGRLLSSCYSYLESIINHLTAGPSLNLDDRQVLQLHSAMVGAFSAVLFFLKKVSTDKTVQWNSITLATVRVLSAWLAEETSALKEEVYDLIPFLIEISKMCIPSEGAYDKISDKTDDEQPTEAVDKGNETGKDGPKVNEDSEKTDTQCETLADNNTDKTLDEKDSQKTDLSIDLENVSIRDDRTEKDKSDKVCKDTNEDTKHEEDSIEGSEKDGKTCDCNQNSTKDNRDLDTQGNVSNTEDSQDKSKTLDLVQNPETKASIFDSGFTIDKEILSDEELRDLHLRVDIFHFLLPGLCHLTAEDASRQILLQCGGLKVLDLYMWQQWEKFVKVPQSRDIQVGWSSLVILCNIFLNFIIVEPALVTEEPVFSHILLMVVKGVEIVEYEEDFMVLWSHMVTLGLMLLRTLSSNIDEGLEADSVSRFFVSAVRFLSGAYTVRYKKKSQATLDVAEAYQQTWDQISQTWFLSMQALCACIPLYKDIPSILMKTGWLPALLKTMNDVKGNGVAEETRACFLMLLTTAAECSKTTRTVIREKGGEQFAKIYKSNQLAELLGTS